MKKYYIAYGSNLNVDQMRFRCPDARIVGRAILKDYKLVFRVHATIEPDPGSVVPVLVWSISQRDEERLDMYEGFPKYYIKETMPVIVKPIKGGSPREISAMVYVMSIDRAIIPPTMTYYNTILDGYTRFGFNIGILNDAFSEAFLAEPPEAAN